MIELLVIVFLVLAFFIVGLPVLIVHVTKNETLISTTIGKVFWPKKFFYWSSSIGAISLSGYIFVSSIFMVPAFMSLFLAVLWLRLLPWNKS